MRIMTVMGTRPEIIRLSQIIRRLDEAADHCLVWTDQNYDPRLSALFFDELDVREPDYRLTVQGATFAEQLGQIATGIDRLLTEVRPTKLMILGDTNSGLAAIVAKRRGVPVYHLEAGNRCYDDRVPEEVNRRVIDHASDVLLPYTERARANLLREGIPHERIYVVGNPILEVLMAYASEIRGSAVHDELGIAPQRYFLATVHRAETVDDSSRLTAVINALESVQAEWGYPMICSLHPRTRHKMNELEVNPQQLRYYEPFGLFDFITLQKSAYCVLTDSGTVQEECCLHRVPCVTLRNVTERPETLECGSNILAGIDAPVVIRAVKTVTPHRADWSPPSEYTRMNVADTVVRIIAGV